jgi:hypothetical protein
MSASVDRDQLAALRVLRYWFGDVQVLEVVAAKLDRDPAPVQATQGRLFNQGLEEGNGDLSAGVA